MDSPSVHLYAYLHAGLSQKHDEYISVIDSKLICVRPHLGAKQGCPLSTLSFSLYIHDVHCLAEVCLAGVCKGLSQVVKCESRTCCRQMTYHDASLAPTDAG
eukprot:scaffold60851_cov19-Tisochrysis_lutea.AAC.2